MTKGERTRHGILTVATQSFYKEGFYRTSLEEICREVGLSQPALYKYFSNKEEVLVECLKLAVREGRNWIDAQVDPKAPAAKALQAYVMANFRWLKERRPQANLVLSQYYLTFTETKARKTHSEIAEETQDRILVFLHRGKHEGSWKLDRPTEVAQMFHSFLFGDMLKAFHEKGVDPRSRAQRTWKWLRLMLS